MPDLPEHLRKQAKARKRDRAIGLSAAQHELAREYGFDSWPKLVHHVQASGLEGIERALVLADVPTLSMLLHADPAAATAEVGGLAPLLVLLPVDRLASRRPQRRAAAARRRCRPELAVGSLGHRPPTARAGRPLRPSRRL